MHWIWDYVAGEHVEVVTSGWGMLSLPRVSPAAGNVSSLGVPLLKNKAVNGCHLELKVLIQGRRHLRTRPLENVPTSLFMGFCSDVFSC